MFVTQQNRHFLNIQPLMTKHEPYSVVFLIEVEEMDLKNRILSTEQLYIGAYKYLDVGY